MSLNYNLRRDRSDAQVAQLNRLNPSSPSNPLPPEILTFPTAADDNRAAAWDPGVDYAQNNRWEETTVRIEYDAGGATLTSISGYQKYNRDMPAQEADGTPYKALQYAIQGDVETFYQELRASGRLFREGNWIVGANYEDDKTSEQSNVTNTLATSRILFGLPNPGSTNFSNNKISTYGIYGNADYPVLPDLSLQAGLRYTSSDRDNAGCTMDRGDGSFSAIFLRIQTALAASGAKTSPIVPIPPGGCVTLNSTFTPTLFTGNLNEDNLSWRVGLNWTAIPGTLIYANRAASRWPPPHRPRSLFPFRRKSCLPTKPVSRQRSGVHFRSTRRLSITIIRTSRLAEPISIQCSASSPSWSQSRNPACTAWSCQRIGVRFPG